MSLFSVRRAVVAIAGLAAIAGSAPAADAQAVCTGDVGAVPTAYVNYCQDVQIVMGGVATTAAGLYICVNGSCTLVPVHRTGAGVNTSTRQVCYVIYGNGGQGYRCI
ncbi:MAG TPA: hypothetical protein VNA20_18715 [Frankiaceae bacterium]|nr:hypothetical protein [Frankiaceae bacterium]